MHVSTIETGVDLHERCMLTFPVLNKQGAARDLILLNFLNVVFACTLIK